MFIEAGNNPVLLFHGGFGFREVGQQAMPGTDLRASMLVKELCSHPWIAATYADGLPDLPWLRPRLRAGGREAAA